VALLTILTTLAYDEFIHRFDPRGITVDDCYPSPEAMRRRTVQAFSELDASGGLAAECWAEYRQKLESWYAHRADFEKFLSEWDSIRAQLQTIVRPPELLIQILEKMGSPTHFDQLDPPTSEAQLKIAFVNSSFIRNRFTLGDLLILLNWDMEQLWSRIWTRSRALAAAARRGEAFATNSSK
jgi:glycerol-1-phosphate dehydrogenase [NAD(P)+]